MKEIRMKVSEELYKEYKIYCVENSLSMAKQTHDLIRKFLDMMKENKKVTKC